MTRGGRECDYAAERLSEDHRPFELERLAELDDVLHPAVEIPLCSIVAVAPPLPTVIEQNELRDIGQRRERVREPRVVEAGAAVQKQQRRPLAHGWTVRDELRADHLEEDPRAVAQRNPHSSATSLSFCRLERTSR
jgi:hypothetical protein